MKLALRVGVSLGVLALLATLLPWNEVRTAVGELEAPIWLGVLGGFLLGHGLGTIKWRRLINAGGSPLSARDAVRCYAAGLFANLCLPSIVGGDVLRAALAARTTGRPEPVVLGGIADRVIDISVLLTLMAAGGLLLRGALPEWGGEAISVILVLGAGTGALLVPFMLHRPLHRWPARLRRPAGRTMVALRRLSRAPRSAAIAVAISLVIQSGFVLLNAWIGGSLGIEQPLAAWFLVWPLAKVAGLAPISLGGLGVRDATLGALFATLGVPLARGVVASLVWQSVLIGGGLLAGMIWGITGRFHSARQPRSRVPADASSGRTG